MIISIPTIFLVKMFQLHLGNIFKYIAYICMETGLFFYSHPFDF